MDGPDRLHFRSVRFSSKGNEEILSIEAHRVRNETWEARTILLAFNHRVKVLLFPEHSWAMAACREKAMEEWNRYFGGCRRKQAMLPQTGRRSNNAANRLHLNRPINKSKTRSRSASSILLLATR